MKSSFLRPALALALAAGLAACGGTATFEVKGVIAGLAYPGLVLTNNGVDLPVAAGATTFAFPGSIEYGETYNVTVKTNPLQQKCEPAPAYQADTAGRLASINIPVLCQTNAYEVSGKITGLTTDGLVLTNGSTGGTIAVAKNATVVAFPPVTFEQSYGITVVKQPAGQTCTVANGVGVMGGAPVTNLDVTCNTAIGG